ncbi:MAG: TIGR04255 family protein [Polyangia bacterium]
MAKQLENKPLVEALVEMKWQLQDVATNVRVDPVYPLFLGRFHERVRDAYPNVEPLPAAHVPDELTPHTAKYRFRASKDGWPVVQVGPGVGTLNFTDSYNWDRFSDAARPFFAKLLEAYAVDGDEPRPQFASGLLRFINAIEFDVLGNDALQFLSEKFHTTFKLPNAIGDAEQVTGPPHALQLSATYRLESPPGIGSVRFSTGAKQERPALLWELNILSQDDQVPQDEHAFEKWLTQAHEVIELWFFALIEGDLERMFEGGE